MKQTSESSEQNIIFKVEREFLGKYSTKDFVKKIIKSHINHHPSTS